MLELNATDSGIISVREIVSTDFRKAEILKKYHIDYCCGGSKSLAEACINAHADLNEVKHELNTLNTADLLPSQNYYYWDADFLCDYIIRTHHQYIHTAREYLLDYAKKVNQNHSKNHPELIELSNLVSEMLQELEMHMVKEEQVLFPKIKDLVQTYQHPEYNLAQALRSAHLQSPISVFENEHDDVGTILSRMRDLTNYYSPPEDACITYKVFYAKLREFDDDLTMHIHLENNLLFPKAQQLAEKFLIQ